jgi:DNA-binding NtrC family response regulator
VTRATTVLLGEQVVRSGWRFVWSDTAGKHDIPVPRRASIGAAEGVELRIRDETVSRLHGELSLEEDGIWVRDLQSRNGTFVNNVRIREARVVAGDVLRVGKTKITVSERGQTVIPLWPSDRFGKLVGRSDAMREVFASMAKVADTELTVLVHGESGTGKELAAESIHAASKRAEGPFVVVDCAALPEQLLDAELFGHRKGAFTGAANDHAGAVEEADGGTLFLDEIGELPLQVQPKLLRLLESKTVRRLGDNKHTSVDVRFIAATHRDLRQMVSQGAFREDLYFRLSVVSLELPPLRERREDIAQIVDVLAPRAEPADREKIVAHAMTQPWPGNVRELRNYVERAAALGHEHAAAISQEPTPGGGDATVDTSQPYKAQRDAWLDRLEREYFSALLATHDHNVSACARIAGVNRTWLHELIRKHGL